MLETLRADLFCHGLSVINLTVKDACARDETLNLGIASAAGNAELFKSLERLNEQIRYVRWVRMARARIKSSKEEYKVIMAALLDRDATVATKAISGHIEASKDQIVASVREGISNIYLDPERALAAPILEEEPT